MTKDKLQQAKETEQRIGDTEKLISICEEFGKQKYKGAMPSEVMNYINADSSVCLEVVKLIQEKAEKKLGELQHLFGSI